MSEMFGNVAQDRDDRIAKYPEGGLVAEIDASYRRAVLPVLLTHEVPVSPLPCILHLSFTPPLPRVRTRCSSTFTYMLFLVRVAALQCLPPT